MGRLTNLNPPKALTETDIPDAMTRDTEAIEMIVTALNAHLAAIHPHAQYARILTTIFTLDLPSLGPNGLDKRFHPLTGAKVGDAAFLVPINTNLLTTAAWPFIFAAVVEAADSVACYFRNDNPASIDLAAIQFRIVVLVF